MRTMLLTIAAAGLLVACDKSKPELDKTLAEVQQISAEKDSLLRDVTANSQLIADVNAEMAKVRDGSASKPTVRNRGDLETTVTPAEAREAVRKRVAELTARLIESEKRLGASRTRVQELAQNSSSMKRQLAAFDSTIGSFRTIMENQKGQIASLSEQLNALQAENASLKTERVQLVSDKVQLVAEKQTLTEERNTTYYMVGNREELLARHVIEMTGGFLGFGKTTVPARELTPTGFTAIDRSAVQEIPFPMPNRKYRVITRQDMSALQTPPDKDGEFEGTLKIADPARFWATSKYLIMVEK